MPVNKAHPSTSVFKDNIFNGQVVFITGGRSGIGYTVVETLMRHGADAVIVGRDAKGLAESAAALQKSTGKRCIAASADVRKVDQIRAAVDKAIEAFGRIDFVVCGAAGNFLAPISALSENAFRTVIEIDTLGTYNTVKATLPHVRKTQGAYLHISATLHYRGVPYQAHVGAAKAAVDALSQVIAVEEGPRGVRSNVVAPGPIANTEGTLRLVPKGSETDIIPRIVPLARFGETIDIGNAAVYLFSPAASYVSGSVLVVDGGEMHIRGTSLPYPESVLDPESTKKLVVGSKL
ncbi:Peroxisomal 2,4-dienoyl-CoA reductase SPS19 [Vanrija pseudolonga]|uniref:2,4-dienoyl-CoA reductase [(3E)-enoyl-CoA-producing] n=1 Tax=Vanrija pseudolonga TaxID=143232 RepID=A0AAF0Y862_9TREE|nr:Peroxisomal 2,4-dienoyl-CoA reductase SPS19 [Vanrija pseudolonga]